MDHPTRRLDPHTPNAEPDRATRRLDDTNTPGLSCPKCGGVMEWAFMEGQTGSYDAQEKNSGVKFLRRKGKVKLWIVEIYNRSGCKVRFCTKCGFVELYVADPQELMKET